MSHVCLNCANVPFTDKVLILILKHAMQLKNRYPMDILVLLAIKSILRSKMGILDKVSEFDSSGFKINCYKKCFKC